MCVQIRHIAEIMEEIAPLDLAEDWDNVGLLIGNKSREVRKILVSLDVTGSVVKEAIEEDIDMIISHHPVIFKPKSFIGQHIEDRNIIYPLIKNDIAVYSAHTNFDKADGGVDDTLATLLGFEDMETLDHVAGFGRVGKIGYRATVEEYARRVAEVLRAENMYIIGDREKMVETVVSCAGAGGDFVPQAADAGADVFVTGEIKYHEGLLALEFGMPVLSLGHYETEAPAMDELTGRLQKKFNDLQYKVEVLSSRAQYSTKGTL